MRKFILSSCFMLFIFLNVYCQTEKSWSMIGGSGYVHLSDAFYFQISPSYGYFIANNLALGADVSYAYGEYAGSAISAGPFMRYYVGEGPNRLLFSGSLAYGDHLDQYNLTSTLTAGVGAGYTRFLTQQVGLEAILRYQNMNNFEGYSNERLFVTIGLQFFLSPRQKG